MRFSSRVKSHWQQAEEYWLIIACSKNMLALHLPENDRTIGMPEEKEGKAMGKGGWGWRLTPEIGELLLKCY